MPAMPTSSNTRQWLALSCTQCCVLAPTWHTQFSNSGRLMPTRRMRISKRRNEFSDTCRVLKQTGLVYSGKHNVDITIQAYCDADYGADGNRKSISGCLF